MDASVLDPRVSNDDALFDECIVAIEREYRRLGHSLGWRFLYGPRAVLRGPVDIALVTLNPGGRSEPGDHPPASCEDGVAFLAERWSRAVAGRSKLQLQVQGLFDLLARHLGSAESSDALMTRSALVSLLPFRSVNFATLHRPHDSLAFARTLWSLLLPRWRPRLIIGLGREVQAEFRALIPASLGMRAVGRSAHLTGWGSIAAELDTYEGDAATLRFLYLPHLSRYLLFTSAQCRSPMDRLIADATEGLR